MNQSGLISSTKRSHSTVCHVVGPSKLECDKLVVRNTLGKLPYDIKLRAPKVRKKELQSFAKAAAESFGSCTSSGSK